MRYNTLLRNAALRAIIAILLLGAAGCANRAWAQISITDQTSLATALQTSGSHTLSADVELSSGVINATATCTITGNGSYKISRAENATDAGIKINADYITLTFVNVVFDGERVVQQTADDGTAMLRNDQPNSTLVLDGCTIPDNFDTENDSSKGGDRLITSANVVLTNCTIGMYGAGNNAESGGGIYVEGGTVEINCTSPNSSKIEYNVATIDGGGIYINDNATVYIDASDHGAGEGVCVRYNQADNHGGGVYKQGTLMVEGLVKVVENKGKVDKTIDVSASPSNGGTVSGGGTYEHGASCTVSATANPGFAFINWTEGGTVVSTNRSYTFNVTGSRNLVANFGQLCTIVATANPNGSGYINGDDIYEEVYVEGATCILYAEASSGSAFENWTENGVVVSTNPTYTFTVTHDRNLVANYSSVCVVVFNLYGGWYYHDDYGEYCEDWGDNYLVVTANGVSERLTVYDDYECYNEYTFYWIPGTHVDLSWERNSSQYCSFSVSYRDSAEEITSVNNPATNYSFSFDVDCSTTITATADPAAGGTVSGAGTYSAGQSCTLTATANPGYVFDRWTSNISLYGNTSNPTYSFTVRGDQDFVAHFLPAYTITATANPASYGTVSGSGSYGSGRVCTVSANANDGYSFVNWTENGSVVSTNRSYAFNVTGNRNLVANFVEGYTIAATTGNANYGTVSGAGIYQLGQSCTLTATPEAHCFFLNWTENGSVVSTDASYTFNVTRDRNLVANFGTDMCTLTFVLGRYDYEEDGCDGWGNNYLVVTANGVSERLSYGGTDQSFECDDEYYDMEFPPGTHVTLTWDGPGHTGSYGSFSGYFYVQNAGWAKIINKSNPTSDYFDEFDVDCSRYTITATVNQGVGGRVGSSYISNYDHLPTTLTQTYYVGQTCYLGAYPILGYVFDYWTRNGVTIDGGEHISFEVTEDAEYVAHFKPWTPPVVPEGAVAGIFGDGRYYLSKGNLQYQASTDTWRFAEHQWDFVGGTDSGYPGTVSGSSNNDISPTYSGWIDLFGWGTSGYYGVYPYLSSLDPREYAHVFNSIVDSNYDWGIYNKISNGGNTSNTWHTDGLRYVIEKRRYVIVNGVYGLMVLPDHWRDSWVNWSDYPHENYVTIISASQWELLENYGAGFLPAAGRREGTTVRSLPSSGLYHLPTSVNPYDIEYMAFSRGEFGFHFTPPERGRCLGFSVRLVADVKQDYSIKVGTSNANYGTVSGGGSFNHGQSCTVTATPKPGCQFVNWTDGGTVVSTNASYTFTVTCNRCLEARFKASSSTGTPTGAIAGKFSINNVGDKVYFSKGNLQYQASTKTWRFATNQYDYIGANNSNISSTYSGWIDLFGWGTSGYNHGASNYQPWSTAYYNAQYYAYGDYRYALYDKTGQADWGYNAISNGGNTTRTWFTLSDVEWEYILYVRPTTSGIRYAKARVNGVNGLILLPDDWSTSYYSLSNTNVAGASYTSNTITTTQWATLEQHGAVFLPVTGQRENAYIGSFERGLYWTSSSREFYPYSYSNWYGAACMVFGDDGLLSGIQNYGTNRSQGLAVRLVRAAQ